MYVRSNCLLNYLRCLLVWGLTLCLTARAGEWFELTRALQGVAADAAANTLVEVDLDSLRVQGTQRSLVLRLSFRPPRQVQAQTVRSLQAILHLSCDQASASWQDAHFFSEEKGGGLKLFEQVYGPSQGPGLALEKTDWLTPASWALLRQSACAQATMATP